MPWPLRLTATLLNTKRERARERACLNSHSQVMPSHMYCIKNVFFRCIFAYFKNDRPVLDGMSPVGASLRQLEMKRKDMQQYIKTMTLVWFTSRDVGHCSPLGPLRCETTLEATNSRATRKRIECKTLKQFFTL